MPMPQKTSEPRALPTPDCDVCETLERDQARFEEAGDVRRAGECAIEIRNHPHPQGRGARP